MQMKNDDEELSYAYNGDGQRVSKTYNGTTTEYFYNCEILADQKTGNDIIVFMYDNNSDAFGFIYNETEYYYVKNAQNDIVAIADTDGTVIANYYYDAWGYPEDIIGNTEIANLNPLRYRSYYYDTESELYYLNSRYYCAEIGRFLSSDGYMQTGQGILDKNMFAYCENNSVNRIDLNGLFWKEIGSFFKNIGKKIGNFFKSTFGAEAKTVHQSKIETELMPNGVNLFITAKSGTKTSKTLSSSGDSSKPVSVYAQGRSDNFLLSSVGLKINIVNFSLDINLGLDNIGVTGSVKDGDTTNSVALMADLTQFKIGAEVGSTVQWDENNSTCTYSNVSVTIIGIIAAYCFATTGDPSFQYAYG